MDHSCISMYLDLANNYFRCLQLQSRPNSSTHHLGISRWFSVSLILSL